MLQPQATMCFIDFFFVRDQAVKMFSKFLTSGGARLNPSSGKGKFMALDVEN